MRKNSQNCSEKRLAINRIEADNERREKVTENQ